MSWQSGGTEWVLGLESTQLTVQILRDHSGRFSVGIFETMDRPWTDMYKSKPDPTGRSGNAIFLSNLRCNSNYI